MKEQFATYEIAVALKELCFDEECFGYYTSMKDWMMKGKYSDGKLHFHGPNWSNSDNTMYFMYVQNSFGDRNSVVKNSYFTKAIKNVATPLWQQAINWFREEHELHITIFSKSQESWMFRITKKGESLEAGLYGEDFDTYEQAREEAILEAIESIKIK